MGGDFSLVLLPLCDVAFAGSETVVPPDLFVEQNIVAVGHAQLLGDADGGFVVWVNECSNAGQLEHVKAVAQDFAGGFCSEALAPVFLGDEVVEFYGLQVGGDF